MTSYLIDLNLIKFIQCHNQNVREQVVMRLALSHLCSVTSLSLQKASFFQVDFRER